MNGNIFVVYTRETERRGRYAVAEKLSKSINLVGYVKDCITFNICDTWKEAQNIAEQWNENFKVNGNQKPVSEW